ncbi:MAG: 1-acyl-sn-glycerol-3-phosphate acyltransferase [Bacteroidota bacterium]
MKIKEIEKKSLRYNFLKKYVDFCFRRFYRVIYVGHESVNTREGALFAANHQNALIDALAILTSFNWQPVFLGRADIFRNKTTAKILRFLKIIPVYRIRDGYEQLANNEQTFREAFRILNNETPIALFPEGNHEGKKKVRYLKKGLARIALSFWEKHPEKSDFKIIPVGLNYSNYHKPFSDLLIIFGQPILVADIDKEYAENPAKTINILQEVVKSRLTDVSLHIDNEAIYNVTDFIIGLFSAKGKAENTTAEATFRLQKEIITTMEDLHARNDSQLAQLHQSVNEIKSQPGLKRIRPEEFEIAFSSNKSFKVLKMILLLIIAAPFYLYSIIQNIIPSLMIRGISRKIKDPQFKSSVFFTGSILLFPVIYLIQSAIVGLVFNSLLVGSVYFLSLLPSFWLQLYWEHKWQELGNAIKILRNLRSVVHHIISITKTFH